MTKRHPAQDAPVPKGYMCAAGCGHGIAVHLEHGCDVASCERPAPFGRIMPGDPPPAPRAADLPQGSVVAYPRVAWIKGTFGWHVTGGKGLEFNRPDSDVDQALALGAQVLRVGTGLEAKR